MTESTGFPDATPPEDAAPVAEPAPAGPAEAPVVQEAPPEAEPVSEAPGAPYVPENQPEWLRLLVAGIDERLRALGG